MLEPRYPVSVDPATPPCLLVVVDTEEEFEWGRGFDRRATSVRAIAHLSRFQTVCDEFGIRPTYVIDYPVATQPEGIAPLREFADAGRAVIGAHLHPWVNPPHEEEVCLRNSYVGNLGRDLESRKLRALADAIEAGFGCRPTVYRAGRYGLGPTSGDVLEAEGFEVDLSVCPGLDLRPQGGPDFTRFPPDLFWFGRERRLLEVPVTAAYVGFLHAAGSWLLPLARARPLRWLRAPGILSRLGALDRLRFSPEGVTTEDHRRLVRSLLRRGQRVFTFSLHSPSVEPGCTPYVRTTADLERFLDTCRRSFDLFLGELGGEATTPLELRDRLASGSARGSS